MHHKAVVKLGTHDNLPVNIQCSCGTGGDFGSREEAVGWMQMNHFRYLGGVNTAEVVDTLPKPQPIEAAEEEAQSEEEVKEAEEREVKPKKGKK